MQTSNAFYQGCPHCGAELELPADAIGQRAVCPACDAEFTILGKQPATAPSARPIVITPFRIEEILGAVSTIHSTRQRRLYAPFLIPYGMLLFLGFAPALWLSDQWNRGAWWASWASVAVFPLMMLLASYVTWVAFQLADDTIHTRTDDETVKWRYWYVPRVFTLGRIGLVLSVFVAYAAFMIVAVRGLIDWSVNATSVGTILLAWTAYVLVAFGTFIISVAALWPLLPMAYRRSIGPSSVRLALRVSSANPLTSLFLSFCVLFLFVGGFSLVSLGWIFAIPLSALIFLVALHRIEGDSLPDDD